MKEVLVNVIPITWERAELKVVESLNRDCDYGLFQIYGDHYSYGKDCLLYIGRAADQKFCDRLSAQKIEGDFAETTTEPKYIRIGRISISPQEHENTGLNIEKGKLSEYIKIARTILVGTHSPAFNQQVSKESWQLSFGNNKEYLLLNRADRGNILPEISTIRNSYMFYNFGKPLSK